MSTEYIYIWQLTGITTQHRKCCCAFTIYTVFLQYAIQNSPESDSLCLAGGVTLNCVATGKIKTWFPNIKNIYTSTLLTCADWYSDIGAMQRHNFPGSLANTKESAF